MLLGVEPTSPIPDYGYILPGVPLEGEANGYEVVQFIEKPSQADAKAMLGEGGRLWNSGLLLAPAQLVIDELERHAHVRVRYHDLDGVEHVEEANGLLAVCHQHEIDQLDGIFWIDRLSRLKRDRLVARYNKLRRG